MRDRNYFGTMMVQSGDTDAMISRATRKYSDVLRPALQIVGTQKDVDRVAGMYILVTKRGPIFLTVVSAKKIGPRFVTKIYIPATLSTSFCVPTTCSSGCRNTKRC